MATPTNTLLGEAFDDLARKSGGWPSDAICYALEAINDNQIMMTGEIPVGHRKDGRPKFAKTKATVFCAVVSNEQYQAVVDAVREARMAPAK